MKITEEMKQKARQADIVKVCRDLGEILIPENPSKGEWRVKNKQGLIICQNYYYWHGSPYGNGKLEGQPPNTSNNTLSFVIYYFGMRFTNAVIYLNGGFNLSQAHATYQKAQAKPIIAPQKAPDNARIIRYLVQERGLDEEIIYETIEQGLLYQEGEHNNCVFVCKDLAGAITGYEVKGILKTKFQRNYGSGLFTLKIGEPQDLWVFESAIDLLSLYEMGKIAGDLGNCLMLSMGGLSKTNEIRGIALQLKAKNQNSTVHIATDNDTAGREFGDYFKEQNTDLNVSLHIPKTIKGNNFKDWNERLIFKKFGKN